MSVPRWLLLIALVFGIAGMHTLGHPEPAHGHDGGVVAGSDHSRSGLTIVPPRDGDHSAVQTSDESLPNLDPLAVCLAILAPLTLLALSLCGLRVRHRAVAGPSARGGRGLSFARPPPRSTAVRLALLSVLRT
ncbi:hypothetical protein [Thermasporomyces composti]|nr:hypothetical protein [Thermasporomyces composti]